MVNCISFLITCRIVFPSPDCKWAHWPTITTLSNMPWVFTLINGAARLWAHRDSPSQSVGQSSCLCEQVCPAAKLSICPREGHREHQGTAQRDSPTDLCLQPHSHKHQQSPPSSSPTNKDWNPPWKSSVGVLICEIHTCSYIHSSLNIRPACKAL